MGNWPLAMLLIGVAGINIGVNSADMSRLAATLMLLIPITLVTYLLVAYQLGQWRSTRKRRVDQVLPE